MRTSSRATCLALLLTLVPWVLVAGKEGRANKRGKIDEALEQDPRGGARRELQKPRRSTTRPSVMPSSTTPRSPSASAVVGAAVWRRTWKVERQANLHEDGSGGVGLGLGVKTYQVIMMFENENVFENFVDNGWQADSQAGVAAGTKGAAAESTFHNGMAVFVRTKKGLIASADVRQPSIGGVTSTSKEGSRFRAEVRPRRSRAMKRGSR